MRITIFNGAPAAAADFQAYIGELAGRLQALGHTVTRLDLATLDLKGCSGCFGCWVKTPGECVKRGDSAELCRSVVNAELLLMASPMKMGFTTALLKRAADQMIPLVQPYFRFVHGAIHHRPRYASYPKFALLLHPGADSDGEDVAITTEIWGRTAINLQSRLAFSATTARCATEIADELTHVA